ncbi:MAG TPA: metallophosphoesterase [Kofleriaceae bacterium]|nr:metallophosphoesterase [Kofleriaceae bacterium]
MRGVHVGLGVCALATALIAAPARRASAEFVKGPYLQNSTPSSVTVMWEAPRNQAAKVIVHDSKGTARTIDVPARSRQEVVIDGLAPASRYRYEVIAGEDHAHGELTTAPEVGAPVPMTFIVFGDTRSASDAHRRLIERIRAEVPDFVLGTGDLVDEGHDQRQWQTFFDVEGPLLRDNVFFPALGNHDRQGRGRTADNYRQWFSLPDNGADAERSYAYTWGISRFVILDSNASSFALTDQTEWLERELMAARQDKRLRHIFVVMHHPPFSISLHGGQRDLRERWTPLFERYGVTAVFSGHDHVYSRAEVGGVRYLVSGGGGAPLYPKSRRPSSIDVDAVKRFERVNHFLRVHVVGDLVEVTAVRVDGTPIETSTWGEAPRPEAPAVAMSPTSAGGSTAASATPPSAPTRAPSRGGSSSVVVMGVLGLLVLAAAAGVWRLVRR